MTDDSYVTSHDEKLIENSADKSGPRVTSLAGYQHCNIAVCFIYTVDCFPLVIASV